MEEMVGSEEVEEEVLLVISQISPLLQEDNSCSVISIGATGCAQLGGEGPPKS